jgi:hypothetical protein
VLRQQMLLLATRIAINAQAKIGSKALIVK